MVMLDADFSRVKCGKCGKRFQGLHAYRTHKAICSKGVCTECRADLRTRDHEITCLHSTYDCTTRIGARGRCGKCFGCKRDGIDEICDLMDEIVQMKGLETNRGDGKPMTNREFLDFCSKMEEEFFEDESDLEHSAMWDTGADEPVQESNASGILRRMRERSNPQAEVEKQRAMAEAERMAREATLMRQQANQMLVSQANAQREATLREQQRRAVATYDSFTLWGEKLMPGSHLTDEQRAQLSIIARNTTAEGGVRTIVQAILDQEPTIAPLALMPIEPEPEIPADLADEMTQRAREALIATGEFAGMEEAVRSGMMDDLSGVRAAIRVMRDMGKPLPALRAQVPAVRGPLQGVVLPREPSIWERMGGWVETLQHRWVRLWSRYEVYKARNLALAADMVNQQTAHKKELAKARKEVQNAKNETQRAREGVRKEIDRRVQSEIKKATSTAVEKALAAFDAQTRRATAPTGGSGVRVSKSIHGELRYVAHDGTSFATKEEANRYTARNQGLQQQTSLAAFLNQASNEQERQALLELAKHAIATRRVDPATGQITLQMIVPENRLDLMEFQKRHANKKYLKPGDLVKKPKDRPPTFR